jgi:hypothetical protein
MQKPGPYFREVQVSGTNFASISGVRYTLLILICSCLACAAPKGVFYEEMAAPPVLRLSNTILTVETTNSTRYSNLAIYSVEVEVDRTGNRVLLKAMQAKRAFRPSAYTINLAQYRIVEPRAWTFYWQDPDKRTTKLSLSN